MRRKILITRPVEDALATADLLRSKGFDPIIESMLVVKLKSEFNNQSSSLPDFHLLTAIIATSANGIRALAQATDQRDVQVITVGNASAKEAVRLGFKQVQSANGDVSALEKYITSACHPNGKFLYITGEHVFGNLQKNLLQKGFDVERLILYQMQQAEKFSDELKEMLKHSEIDTVLFYSKRTAETFLSLAEKEGLNNSLKNIKALCLSKAITEIISPANWLSVSIADNLTQESLLVLLT